MKSNVVIKRDKSQLGAIAGRLGVAKSSVSRALSGKGGVSGKLRRKVLSLAKNLSYSPNPYASVLRTGKRQGLAVISGFMTHVVMLRNRALLDLGQEYFGTVRFFVISAGEGIEGAVLQAISFNPQAIVVNSVPGLLGGEIVPRLLSYGIPIVSIDCENGFGKNIRIDRSAGTGQAARLLILSGCENPVYLSASDIENPDARLDGIIEAYSSLGKKLSASQIFPIGGMHADPIRAGYDAARKIISTTLCDGIFAYSDEMALGVARALADAKIKVPDEIRLVGFDNLPFAEFVCPSLTTVAQPIREPVDVALKACIEDSGNAKCERSFETRLLVRESAPALSKVLMGKIFK